MAIIYYICRIRMGRKKISCIDWIKGGWNSQGKKLYLPQVVHICIVEQETIDWD